MSKDLFASRPVDEDTKILSAEYCNRDGFHTLLESWFWDGIRGKSLILLADQVKEQTDAAIIDMVSGWLGLTSADKTTFKRGERFVYFNFGFKS